MTKFHRHFQMLPTILMERRTINNQSWWWRRDLNQFFPDRGWVSHTTTQSRDQCCCFRFLFPLWVQKKSLNANTYVLPSYIPPGSYPVPIFQPMRARLLRKWDGVCPSTTRSKKEKKKSYVFSFGLATTKKIQWLDAIKFLFQIVGTF